MSGRKNTLPPIPIVTAGNMSGNVTSISVGVQYLDFISIEVVITGTPTGTLDVQISHDNSNWVSVPLSSTAVITSGSPSPIIFENIEALPAPWVRMVYTATSGSGTMSATLSARQG